MTEENGNDRIPLSDLLDVEGVERLTGGVITRGAARALLFARDANGLEDAGAVVRLGRRVYFRRSRLEAWLATNPPAVARPVRGRRRRRSAQRAGDARS